MLIEIKSVWTINQQLRENDSDGAVENSTIYIAWQNSSLHDLTIIWTWYIKSAQCFIHVVDVLFQSLTVNRFQTALYFSTYNVDVINRFCFTVCKDSLYMHKNCAYLYTLKSSQVIRVLTWMLMGKRGGAFSEHALSCVNRANIKNGTARLVMDLHKVGFICVHIILHTLCCV